MSWTTPSYPNPPSRAWYYRWFEFDGEIVIYGNPQRINNLSIGVGAVANYCQATFGRGGVRCRWRSAQFGCTRDVVVVKNEATLSLLKLAFDIDRFDGERPGFAIHLS